MARNSVKLSIYCLTFIMWMGTGCVDSTDSADPEELADQADPADETPGDASTEMVVQSRALSFQATTIHRTIPSPSAYEMGTNGNVYVSNRKIGLDYNDTTMDADFFNVTQEISFQTDVDYIVEANGIDDCSLGIYMMVSVGLESDFNAVDWLNAGDLSVITNGITVPLEWAYINKPSQSVRYFLYDFPESLQSSVSGNIEVIATGKETPAFTAGSVVTEMPAKIALLTPQHEDSIQGGPLEVTWTPGNAEDVVDLRMAVFRKTNVSELGYEMEDIHEIRCTVTDDGQFAVPAALMNQLPANYAVTLELARQKIEYHEVETDFIVKTIATQSVEIDMAVPETMVVRP